CIMSLRILATSLTCLRELLVVERPAKQHEVLLVLQYVDVGAEGERVAVLVSLVSGVLDRGCRNLSFHPSVQAALALLDLGERLGDLADSAGQVRGGDDPSDRLTVP